MKILKPKFWEKKNSLISIILFPISFCIQILFILKKKILKKKFFKIPIICVGNIYLGGTGKTPLSIWIVNELKKYKKKSIIVKKYYSKHIDEHKLITDNLIDLELNNSRANALEIVQKKDYDYAILDDGFQDFSVNKNLNIVCFNSNQLIGNGLTLPSGPLRESINGLKRCQIVIINGEKNLSFEKQIVKISDKIQIFYSKYFPVNIDKLKNKKFFAFAGIGNPNNFFDLLKKNNILVEKKFSFPDHFHYKKSDIQSMINESLKNDCELITTEKDYFRIKDLGFDKIQYLKIELKIFEKEKIINKILDCKI
ncbi:MAG: tetraacyldisaccharide 4'-kinase [Pelagibacteraceae bacterium]|nr:tetraacyldisaccharide 4'-kinase [Pelagibacteraceae bacterium]|tara:strand:- start:12594 stop:13526 length:933 start_codon:yes stop_codon:yes gene_type:complete